MTPRAEMDALAGQVRVLQSAQKYYTLVNGVRATDNNKGDHSISFSPPNLVVSKRILAAIEKVLTDRIAELSTGGATAAPKKSLLSRMLGK